MPQRHHLGRKRKRTAMKDGWKDEARGRRKKKAKRMAKLEAKTK